MDFLFVFFTQTKTWFGNVCIHVMLLCLFFLNEDQVYRSNCNVFMSLINKPLISIRWFCAHKNFFCHWEAFEKFKENKKLYAGYILVQWKHRWLNTKNWLKLIINYSKIFYFNERKANTTTQSLYKYFLLDKSALYVPLNNVDVEFLRMKRSSFIPQFSQLKSWNNNWSSTIFL